MYCSPAGAPDTEEFREANRTQASTVRLVGLRAGAVGYLNVAVGAIKAESRTNHAGSIGGRAALEGAIVGAAMSFAFPSPGHHPTRPDGAEEQIAGGPSTVKTATALVTEPAVLVTTTV